GRGVPVTPPPGGSSSNLSVYLTDDPLAGAQAVWVALRSVSIRDAGTGQWIPVVSFAPAREFDILSLQTVRQLIAAVRVPPGTYDRVRLDIAGVRVVRNGESQPATLATNPVDIPVTLTVRETGAVELTIDIEASLALVETITGFQFDPGRIKVLPPTAPIEIPPGAGGNIVPPPPGDNSDPSRRPVVVHGKVLQILPENQAFVLHAEDDGGIQPQDHPDREDHNILVLTRNDTRYFPEGKGFADLAVGMRVAVAGVSVISESRAAIVAFEVYMRVDEPPSNDTIRGVILEILKDLRLVKLGKPWDDSGWIVADGNGGGRPGQPSPGLWQPPMEYTWVAITDRTQIRTPDGTPLTIDDLRVGQFTKVTGVWRSADIFEAFTMIVSDQGPPQTEHIEGVIVEINAFQRILSVAVQPIPWSMGPAPSDPTGDAPVRLVRVRVTDETVITGPDGTPLSFENLAIGMYIEATGRFDGDLFVAATIYVLDGPPAGVWFAGTIREKDDANRILILDFAQTPIGDPGGMELPPLRIKVTEDTQIEDSSGNPMTWNDLAVGMFIHGEGTPSPEEMLIVAHIIRVGEVPPPPPAHLAGRIVDIRPETQSFVLAFPGGGGISPPGGGGGFQPMDAGSPGQPPERLVEVFTDEDTEFLDADGSVISFGDLQIGDFVECAGEWMPEDPTPPGFHAHRVHRLPTPPPVIVRGSITRIDSEHRSFLLDVAFDASDLNSTHPLILVQTNEGTLYFGPDGQPITFEDLAVGDQVTVMGKWLPRDPGRPPAMMAHEVHQHGSPPPPPGQQGFVFGLVSGLEVGPSRGHFNLGPPCDSPSDPNRPELPSIVVLFDRSVFVVDRQNNGVLLENLANGQLVLVYGEWSMLAIFPPQFIAHKIVILDTDETTNCVHGKVVEIDYTHRILILSRESNATDRIRVQVPADAWIVLPNGERIQLDNVQTGDFLTVMGDRTGETSGAISADLVLKHLPPPG
ncbi:MAG: DUF4382 domain-containing protein, partial [bacterium JZ-2024 1]